MSKSLENYIGIREPAAEIFGKTMSISDQLMVRYYELLSDLDLDRLEALQADLDSGRRDPMQAKKALAEELVARCHSRQAAVAAREAFERQVQRGERPAEIPEIEVGFAADSEWLPGVLARAGLVTSTSEAIRLIRQGGIRVEEEKVSDKDFRISARTPVVVRVGKRRYARIIPRPQA
jgi:tyrosyl-tRNA synthetase